MSLRNRSSGHFPFPEAFPVRASTGSPVCHKLELPMVIGTWTLDICIMFFELSCKKNWSRWVNPFRRYCQFTRTQIPKSDPWGILYTKNVNHPVFMQPNNISCITAIVTVTNFYLKLTSLARNKWPCQNIPSSFLPDTGNWWHTLSFSAVVDHLASHRIKGTTFLFNSSQSLC